MKTILVPVEDHDSMAAVLQAAWLVARRFDSYVEGFAVQPAASEFVALDPLSGLTMPQIADGDAHIERYSRQMFESFMASNNVPPAPPAFPTPPPTEGVSCAWVRPGAEFDTFIGSYGVFPLATILCVSTIAITAGYILWRLGSVFFGPLLDEWGTLGDAIWRERLAVGLLAAATLLISLVPSVVANMSAGGVAPIAARLTGLGS